MSFDKLLLPVALLGGLLALSGCGSSGSTPQYTVTLSASPSAGGTVAPADSVYDEGATAEITATANQQWIFARWEGDHTGTSSTATVTVDADKDITAIFEKKQYALTVNTTGQGDVAEQVVSKSTDYEAGTTVELTANPAEGYQFVEWTGDLTGTENPAQITVDSPKEVTAVFESTFYLASNGVTIKCEDANIDEAGTVDGVEYTKRSAGDITTANAATTCTSGITDMSYMFQDASLFNGDISQWDVSSVTDMNRMFYGAESFNQDISSWDVSSVTDMSYMFQDASLFNGDINQWDVSSVTDMKRMFNGASAFNGDLSSWDVSGVTNMRLMFYGASSFNQDLSSWDVSSVTDMRSMFWNASAFNQDLNDWDVSSVTNMSGIFRNATLFNGDISSWNVSNIINMRSMFWNASAFNQDLNDWDVSSVMDMYGMFYKASSFNQDISSWCVSQIDSEPSLFNYNAGFEGNSSIQPQWGTCPSP